MRRHGLATSVAPTPIGDAGHNTSPIIHYNTNPHITTYVLERYQNALQVFPTSSTSHAALRVSVHYILSSVVHGSSPQQFASSYSYSHPLLGHSFVHPLPCRCCRSSRAEPWQPPGHTATTAHRPSAASVTAARDIRAAVDPICTAGRVWEMQ
jgi:hypothetical protein